MPYDPTRHRRRSIRLAGYDYTQPGAYFITICTHNRRPLLATFDANGHALTAIGAIVARCWLALPGHFSHARLDAWVLMPDHLHGVVVLREDATHEPNAAASAGPNGTRPGSLNAILQNFKSISSRKVNRFRGSSGTSLWQRDYYEHSVRDAADLERIRRYIAANPRRWRS